MHQREEKLPSPIPCLNSNCLCYSSTSPSWCLPCTLPPSSSPAPSKTLLQKQCHHAVNNHTAQIYPTVPGTLKSISDINLSFLTTQTIKRKKRVIRVCDEWLLACSGLGMVFVGGQLHERLQAGTSSAAARSWRDIWLKSFILTLSQKSLVKATEWSTFGKLIKVDSKRFFNSCFGRLFWLEFNKCFSCL